MCRHGRVHGVYGNARRCGPGRLRARCFPEENRLEEGSLDLCLRWSGRANAACFRHVPHHLLPEELASEGPLRHRIRPDRVDGALEPAPHQRQQPDGLVLWQHWPRACALPHRPCPHLPILVVDDHLARGLVHRVDFGPDRLQGPPRWLLGIGSVAPVVCDPGWCIV